jgi:hypothetical protein
MELSWFSVNRANVNPADGILNYPQSSGNTIVMCRVLREVRRYAFVISEGLGVAAPAMAGKVAC